MPEPEGVTDPEPADWRLRADMGTSIGMPVADPMGVADPDPEPEP